MAYFTDQMGEEFRKAIEDVMNEAEELGNRDAMSRTRERKGPKGSQPQQTKSNRSKKNKPKRIRTKD